MTRLLWARRARKHRIGRSHAAYVMATAMVVMDPGAPHSRLSWVGEDDRGLELEVAAVWLPSEDVLLIIHVMPTSLRRNR